MLNAISKFSNACTLERSYTREGFTLTNASGETLVVSRNYFAFYDDKTYHTVLPASRQLVALFEVLADNFSLKLKGAVIVPSIVNFLL